MTSDGDFDLRCGCGGHLTPCSFHEGKHCTRVDYWCNGCKSATRMVLPAGECPCATDARDPGPYHIAACPYLDPNYVDPAWP